MSVDTLRLKARFDQLRSGRAVIENVWDEVEKYIMPLGQSARPQGGESGVEWKRSSVWDFTAVDGLQKFAASIHGSVTSPAIRWFRFGFSDPELTKNVEAMKWLDAVTDIIWADLQESDFNTEIASGYQEFVGYGNMALMVEARSEEEWKGLDFTVLPIREVFFEPDTSNGWCKFYRFLRWTPVQVVDHFEGSERPLPDDILTRAANSSSVDEKVEIVFCIFEREEVDEKVYPAVPEKREYGYVYFRADNGEQLGDEGGYYDEQAFVGRWEKTANSMWGHGPGIISLPTVKYLNAFLELTKAAAEKAVDPAWATTERGLLSDLNLKPGTISVVQNKDSLWPLESGQRVEVGDATVAELRAMVRQLYRVDELQLKDSPAMTATEVQVRYELMNRVMGSTLARLTSEILDPMLHAVLGIEFRAGRLPPMPEVVKTRGGEATIQYQGPLSRSQRTDEVAAAERGASLVAALIKNGFPEAADLVNVEGFIRSTFERLGVPAQLLRSEDEVKKLRSEREAMQKAAMEAEVQKTQAQALQAGAAAQASMASTPARPPPLLSPTVMGG